MWIQYLLAALANVNAGYKTASVHSRLSQLRPRHDHSRVSGVVDLGWLR
jgi:hypothetical protein